MNAIKVSQFVDVFASIDDSCKNTLMYFIVFKLQLS